MNPELVGWASAAVLLATIAQQVFTQWKSGATAGLSKWLFVGQTLASLGFAAYSALTGSMVFLVVNVALLVSAIAGELIYLRNRRRKGQGTKRACVAAPPPAPSASADTS